MDRWGGSRSRRRMDQREGAAKGIKVALAATQVNNTDCSRVSQT